MDITSIFNYTTLVFWYVFYGFVPESKKFRPPLDLNSLKNQMTEGEWQLRWDDNLQQLKRIESEFYSTYQLNRMTELKKEMVWRNQYINKLLQVTTRPQITRNNR